MECWAGLSYDSIMAMPVTRLVNTAIDGDASKLFAISLESTNASSTTDGHIQFQAASAEEIATYRGQPMQRWDAPIANPWSPDPDAQLADLPE